jgi:hypothetical protein
VAGHLALHLALARGGVAENHSSVGGRRAGSKVVC